MRLEDNTPVQTNAGKHTAKYTGAVVRKPTRAYKLNRHLALSGARHNKQRLKWKAKPVLRTASAKK
jgi:hypothetical protein